MASFQINLADRYNKAFGILIPTSAATAAVHLAAREANIGLGLGTIPYIGKSIEKYEAEILDIITLEVINDNSETLTYRLELPAVIRWSRKKRVTKTVLNRDQVSGVDAGEVIESSGWSPWQISIQGLVISDNHLTPPYQAVEGFDDFLSWHKVYKVESQLFNALSIENLVILDESFSAVADFPDTMSFTIKAQSHVSPQALIKTE